MTMSIARICRYPVKGMNAESLDGCELTPGEGVPHDRRFAIAHGGARFPDGKPAWVPRSNFLNLSRNERLALLRAEFDADGGMLTIRRDGKQVARGKVTEPIGRTLIDQFLGAFFNAEARGSPRLVEAPGVMFSDVKDKLVSIINLSSVLDLADRLVRAPVDPGRFRGNIYVEGAAWSEFDWVGRDIAIGAARLHVVERIERCAATNVDPETAVRDLNIPLALKQGYDHVDMGVLARVDVGGAITVGDEIGPPG